MAPGGDGHRTRAHGARAGHVLRRVSDDDGRGGAVRSRGGAAALQRDSGDLGANLRVGPIPPHSEPRGHTGGGELEPRRLLDVPGQQPQSHVVAPLQRRKQVGHARQQRDPPRRAPDLELPAQRLQVGRPERRHATADLPFLHPRRAQ